MSYIGSSSKMVKERYIQKYSCWRKNRKITRENPEIWVLKSSNIAYIQIPKVASRSIRQCLAKSYVETENLEPPRKWDKESIRTIENKTAFHASHKKINHLTKNYFVFSFVRNPYSRVYSAYKNKVMQPLERTNKNIFFNHGISLGMDLDKFVDIICAIPDHKIDRHLRSQSWFLTFQGQLIPNYIGRLESFEKDWKTLSNDFELPKAEIKNSTQYTGYRDLSKNFSLEAKEKIRARYHKDFLLFNYSDEL